MSNYNAHVVVFAYKRPQHLKMTLERLAAAEGASVTSVTIFIDGPKNEAEKNVTQETYNIAMRNYNFASKEVKQLNNNLGLAKSITSGVSKILESNEQVIVLEDDILVGHGFLSFMNNALHQYNKSNNVFSISGYVPFEVGVVIEKLHGVESAAFAPRPGSWGWATWRRAWECAEWAKLDVDVDLRNTVWPLKVCGNDILNMFKLESEGLIDSWAVLWAVHHYIHGGMSLYPSASFVENIGMDGTGTNCGITQRFSSESIGINSEIDWPSELSVDPEILKAFCNVYNRKPGSYIKWSIFRLLKKLGLR